LIGFIIGERLFGKVYIAKEKTSQYIIALKEISISWIMKANNAEILLREAEIQGNLRENDENVPPSFRELDEIRKENLTKVRKMGPPSSVTARHKFLTNNIRKELNCRSFYKRQKNTIKILGIIENSNIFQNSLNSEDNLIVENNNDDESNLEDVDDSENISLESSVDTVLDNLLSLFNTCQILQIQNKFFKL
ncbi:9839_t:CDS:2, partial [Entrophospora sp. SA101]